MLCGLHTPWSIYQGYNPDCGPAPNQGSDQYLPGSARFEEDNPISIPIGMIAQL